MILAIVAVGQKYVDNVKLFLNKFSENTSFKIKILTDQPDSFPEHHTQKYEKKIFSYFDKLLFSFRLSENHKEDVIYIDADWIQFVNVDEIKNFTGDSKILFFDNFPTADTMADLQDNYYYKPFINLLDKNMIKYEDIITIQEFIFYLPYLNNISDIIYDTEKVKPIFEYMSVLTETKFGGIGSSEGLGLSYVIYKNGLLADKFDKKYFK